MWTRSPVDPVVGLRAGGASASRVAGTGEVKNKVVLVAAAALEAVTLKAAVQESAVLGPLRYFRNTCMLHDLKHFV